MSGLEAVVYVSSANGLPSETELESLLAASRKRNSDLSITGVLLYHDGTFFQYFEGPADRIDSVYKIIRHSRLHHGLIELMREPIQQRLFPDWLMGFTQAPASTMLKLANATWRSTLDSTLGKGIPSDGLALLQQFWDMSSSRG